MIPITSNPVMAPNITAINMGPSNEAMVQRPPRPREWYGWIIDGAKVLLSTAARGQEPVVFLPALWRAFNDLWNHISLAGSLTDANTPTNFNCQLADNFSVSADLP